MHNTFGPITLFGSGETLPASGAAYEFTAAYLKASPEIAILETPAGFQPNTEIVARKVAEFIETRLQNYHPATRIIPARISEGKYSTNNEAKLNLPEKTDFEGIFPALVSPFHEDCRINLDALVKLVSTLNSRPIKGFYICGTTAEADK